MIVRPEQRLFLLCDATNCRLSSTLLIEEYRRNTWDSWQDLLEHVLYFVVLGPPQVPYILCRVGGAEIGARGEWAWEGTVQYHPTR